MSATRRQRLVVDLDQLGGVLGAARGCRPATMATISPTWRAASRHSANWGACFIVDVDARREPGRDGAEERQRLHPALEVGEGEDAGHARQARAAASVRMAAMRAWACGLRTKAAWSMPGQLDVVDEAAFAAQEARVFAARHRRAEVLGSHCAISLRDAL